MFIVVMHLASYLNEITSWQACRWNRGNIDYWLLTLDINPGFSYSIFDHIRYISS